jgi:hypothetical protein
MVNDDNIMIRNCNIVTLKLKMKQISFFDTASYSLKSLEGESLNTGFRATKNKPILIKTRYECKAGPTE